jgi:hypothetical protein
MVEITYQMVLSTLQTAGILVGIFYYVMTIRANKRNQEISLKNQQLRTAYSVFDIYRDEKEYLKWLEVMQMEWVDYDDFTEKYGSRTNPEMEAKWGTMFQFYDGLGYLWKSGVLDLDNLKELIGFGCVVMWKKFKPIVEAWRKDVYLDHFINWQHLAEALEPMISDRIPD